MKYIYLYKYFRFNGIMLNRINIFIVNDRDTFYMSIIFEEYSAGGELIKYLNVHIPIQLKNDTCILFLLFIHALVLYNINKIT